MEKALEKSTTTLLPACGMTVENWIGYLQHKQLPTMTTKTQLERIVGESIPDADLKQCLDADIVYNMIFGDSFRKYWDEFPDVLKACDGLESTGDISNGVWAMLSSSLVLSNATLNPLQQVLHYLNILSIGEVVLAQVLANLRHLLGSNNDGKLTLSETLLLRELVQQPMTTDKPTATGLKSSLERLHKALSQNASPPVAHVKTSTFPVKEEVTAKPSKDYEHLMPEAAERLGLDPETLRSYIPNRERQVIDWSLFNYYAMQNVNPSSGALPKIKTVVPASGPLIAHDAPTGAQGDWMDNIKRIYNDGIPTSFDPSFRDIAAYANLGMRYSPALNASGVHSPLPQNGNYRLQNTCFPAEMSSNFNNVNLPLQAPTNQQFFPSMPADIQGGNMAKSFDKDYESLRLQQLYSNSPSLQTDVHQMNFHGSHQSMTFSQLGQHLHSKPQSSLVEHLPSPIVHDMTATDSLSPPSDLFAEMK